MVGGMEIIKKEATNWCGLKPNSTKFFGFIYLITNKLTGRLYIGKKQYWMKKNIKGCKSVITDKQALNWKPECWRESDWRNYKGSSNDLTKDIREFGTDNFQFKIIKHCRSRGSLTYSEIAEQVLSGCLWRILADGVPLYYNKRIAAVKFKPPIYTAEAAIKPKQRKAYDYKG